MTDVWLISCEIALRWMSLDLFDGKSTLVQTMAWCHQATSHYLSQCWPRALSLYGITRPQEVNTLRPRQNGCHFADNIFKCIFLNENVRISLKISLGFVRKVWINNIPALVQIMAWCLPGDMTSHYLDQWWLVYWCIYITRQYRTGAKHSQQPLNKEKHMYITKYTDSI